MRTPHSPVTRTSSRTLMARATCNCMLPPETGRPVLPACTVYLPLEDIRHEYLAAAGVAAVRAEGAVRYCTVRGGGRVNTRAAWCYPHPPVRFTVGRRVERGSEALDQRFGRRPYRA